MPYEPNQKLPFSITYLCADAILESAFVRMFAIWNFVCDGAFTLQKSTGDSPTIITVSYGLMPIPMWTGNTTRNGNTTEIAIVYPPIRLDITMLHEIGHALGLAHNASDPYSIMNPITINDSAVDQNDIDDVRFLYGLQPKSFDWGISIIGRTLVARALYGPKRKVIRQRLVKGSNDIVLSWLGVNTYRTIQR